MRKITLCLFFISGFCALLYQLLWVRLAFMHFGVITPVLSVVVSVFMLGLGLGSWIGGRWANERQASPLVAYAVIEGVTGVGAFMVPRLFQAGDTWLLTQGAMDSRAYLVNSALWIAATLLPWCTAMGTTFPIMMEAWRRKTGERTSFSALYTANVLGALTGTALTALVFIELFGFRDTGRIGGILNFSIAGVSLWLASREKGAVALPTQNDLPLLRLTQPLPAALALFTLALTGFITLSLEVAWTRLFTPVLFTTIYSFASVLGTYLLATSVGVRCYRRQVSIGTPYTFDRVLGFLIGTSFLPVILNDPRLHNSALGVLLSIFPLCAGLGYLTPMVMDLYSQGHPAKAGWAYAINTGGCIAGPLVTSYLLLPYFGAKEVMLGLTIPLGLLVIAAPSESGRFGRRLVFVLCAGVAGIVIWKGCLSYEDPLTHDGPWVVRRDPTATVISAGTGMDKALFVNGINTTNLSTIAKLSTHLGMISHQGPAQTGLSICFGMGTTFRGLLSWGLESTGVDVVPGVIQAFDYYYDDVPAIRRNPRAHLVVDDGRRFLRRTTQTFDMITVDPPPHIDSAGLSLLYSKEFLSLAKSRLKDGGIFHLWVPIWGEDKTKQAIARNIAETFPYTQVYLSIGGWGYHFIASNRPLIRPTVDEFIQRLPPLAKKDLLEWEPDKDVRKAVARVLEKPLLITDLYTDHSAVILDDRPYNEYYFLRRARLKIQKGWALLKHVGR